MLPFAFFISQVEQHNFIEDRSVFLGFKEEFLPKRHEKHGNSGKVVQNRSILDQLLLVGRQRLVVGGTTVTELDDTSRHRSRGIPSKSERNDRQSPLPVELKFVFREFLRRVRALLPGKEMNQEDENKDDKKGRRLNAAAALRPLHQRQQQPERMERIKNLFTACSSF